MNVFFSSDWHFSHTNLCMKFVREDGTPARIFTPDGETTPRAFVSTEEMDEIMIERHNRVVGQYDKFYTLGDVGFDLKRYHSIMPRLNGKKRLILGNHDKFAINEYARHFEKIMESWQPVRNIVFTHRPIRLGEDDHHEKIKANVHGHTHNHLIPSANYLNICVEHTNYTPIHFDEIKLRLKRQGADI